MQQVIIEAARTVTVTVWPLVVLITEAAIDTVLLTTPLILGTVQLFTRVGLICANKDARDRKSQDAISEEKLSFDRYNATGWEHTTMQI